MEGEIVGEQEARALGASDCVTVKGKKYKLSPISIGVLAEIQREALRSYKRQYLQTFLDVQDSLPPGKLDAVIEEVAHWDVDKLPNLPAYSCRKIEVNQALQARLAEFYGPTVSSQKQTTLQSLLTAALDEAKITSDEIERLTGTAPVKGFIPYDLWWSTASHEGRILFVWSALQEHHSEVSRTEVKSWSPVSLIEASQLVERITTPDVGNT